MAKVEKWIENARKDFQWRKTGMGFWDIKEGVRLEIIRAGQRLPNNEEMYMVIQRINKEFSPVVKGSYNDCKRFVDKFRSFFEKEVAIA